MSEGVCLFAVSFAHFRLTSAIQQHVTHYIPETRAKIEEIGQKRPDSLKLIDATIAQMETTKAAEVEAKIERRKMLVERMASKRKELEQLRFLTAMWS